MKKKWIKNILIIAVLFVFIGISVFVFKKHEESEDSKKEQLRKEYFYQNTAFFATDTPNTQYAPYSTLELHFLQAYLNYYYETTGIEVTLSDIEEFLEDQYNKEGVQKTYKDDEGLIYDYVEYYNNNYTSFRWYVGELDAIISDYVVENLGCSYRTILDLPLDLINEVSKKHRDEKYQLILE